MVSETDASLDDIILLLEGNNSLDNVISNDDVISELDDIKLLEDMTGTEEEATLEISLLEDIIGMDAETSVDEIILLVDIKEADDAS